MDEQELRAMDADSILRNPLYKETIANMREKLVQQIELCPWDNDQYRDKLMLSLQLLKNFQTEFENAITTGQLSAWVEKQPQVE